VVRVDLKIPLPLNRQIDEAVAAQQIQHVIAQPLQDKSIDVSPPDEQQQQPNLGGHGGARHCG